MGDAGLNFDGDSRDITRKNRASQIPLTFLCVHGNHEMRPYEAEGYELVEWHSGMVYCQKKYPRLLFARDGEIYDINGKRCLVIGGADSVDKPWRIRNGYSWFPSEQPDDAVIRRVEEKLDSVGWKEDMVLSHTCPLKYEPIEVFVPGLNQDVVDKSMERWLDTIKHYDELFKLFTVMTGDPRFEETANEVREEGGPKTMCEGIPLSTLTVIMVILRKKFLL